MMYIGISAGFHDAALSVVDSSGEIVFAGHSERHSKSKHDANLCYDLIKTAMEYVNEDYEVHYYERPFIKSARQYLAGQEIGPLSMKKLIHPFVDAMPDFEHKKVGKIKTHSHHLSHAAAGFQTSPYDDATVVVIDAIGELDTITIWHAEYDSNGVAQYTKLWSQQYPHSIGLFYSAVTDYVGLKPLDEEYILMGMAAYGDYKNNGSLSKLWSLVKDSTIASFSENLHTGIPQGLLDGEDHMNIAASAQYIVESMIMSIMSMAKNLGKSKNLVYGGGVALNCVANQHIGCYFDNIWIMPNPGDAGSSLGAAALGYGKKLHWKNAFLGYDIPGPYPVRAVIDELLTTKIAGVASGRAEFGPRSLGNRSLLADPRGPDIKDAVNEIKKRQKFRPFAPVILEEHADSYFVMPRGWPTSPYMQVVARCKQPNLFPAIVHADHSSRVQTVPDDGSGIRQLLEAWYRKTGCPMLLNTSLNIRGQPIVNTVRDAKLFEKLYGVKVFS